MNERRLDAALRLAEGTATAHQLAAELGTTAAEVESWRTLFIEGARRRPRSWGRPGVTAALLLLVVGIGGRAALAAGTCAQTLPSPLVTLCADEPAVAAEVNGNFQALHGLVTGKVGPATSQDVVVGGVLRAPNGAVVSNNASVNGALAVTGRTTTDLLTVRQAEVDSLFVGTTRAMIFGGWYCPRGTGGSISGSVNPLTNANSCPAGFTAAEMFNTGGIQNCDASFGVCQAVRCFICYR